MNDERRPAESEEPASSKSRWPALFPRSQDPLFLLNQHRRVLQVNCAFEELAGVSAAEMRGLRCSLRELDADEPAQALAAALTPPAELLAGRAGRVRRLARLPNAQRVWWEIDFLPLTDTRGRLRLLGKISPGQAETETVEEILPAEFLALRESVELRYRLEDLPVASPVGRRLFEQARLAASSNVPIFVHGSAGSGKNWLARVVHHSGTAQQRNFAALDAGCLPAVVLDGVLFGQRGLARDQELGTLVIGDLAALPRDLQARLVDWLDEATPASARLIAAGSRHPDEEMRAGRLLEPLHARLSTLVIAVPALKDRADDLPVFVERMGKGLDLQPVWASLRAYSWPGNLRELRAVLQQLARRAPDRPVDEIDLPPSLRLTLAAQTEELPAQARPINLDEVLEQVERRLITRALVEAKGNKTKAAEALSIWRARLIRRVEALGIDVADPDAPGDSS